jgi:hypothetical protein
MACERVAVPTASSSGEWRDAVPSLRSKSGRGRRVKARLRPRGSRTTTGCRACARASHRRRRRTVASIFFSYTQRDSAPVSTRRGSSGVPWRESLSSGNWIFRYEVSQFTKARRHAFQRVTKNIGKIVPPRRRPRCQKFHRRRPSHRRVSLIAIRRPKQHTAVVMNEATKRHAGRAGGNRCDG